MQIDIWKKMTIWLGVVGHTKICLILSKIDGLLGYQMDWVVFKIAFQNKNNGPDWAWCLLILFMYSVWTAWFQSDWAYFSFLIIFFFCWFFLLVFFPPTCRKFQRNITLTNEVNHWLLKYIWKLFNLNKDFQDHFQDLTFIHF